MSERAFKEKLRVQRLNRDKGWREMLSTPAGREAIWELYHECLMDRDVVRGIDGATSPPDTFRAIGKCAIGHWLANRCMLVDHQNWLVLLAENERPYDDGRAQDKQDERAEAEAESEAT